MTNARSWGALAEPISGSVEQLQKLAGVVSDEQVRAGIYTEAEMDALGLSAIDGERECSWAAPREFMAGPLTMVAKSDEGDVIAGIEMWQQERDRFWIREVLVRDQSPFYKGRGGGC